MNPGKAQWPLVEADFGAELELLDELSDFLW